MADPMSTILDHIRTKIGHKLITGSQIRMARGYAKLSVKDLASVSEVAESTIKRMEAVEGTPASSGTNLVKVQEALEAQGIQFLDTGEVAGGPGVALKEVSE